jgi:HEXXH motif-containing protein
MEDTAAPWLLAADAGHVHQPAEVNWIWQRVAAPPVNVRCELEDRGFRFDPTWNDKSFVHLTLSSARLIALVPSLEAAVLSAVENIHLLSADPTYDISHSEPRWRTSIFVSRPDRTGQVGELRFAENVIHEAMHLHLTNNEESTPLVQDFDGVMASPWRTDARSIQGVLHGLFVFTCLAVYFRTLLASRVIDAAGRNHIAQRLAEIGSEVAELDIISLAAGLTLRGTALAGEWRRLAVVASN